MNVLKDFYFEKISNCDNAIIPTRGTKDSAGYDFYSLEEVTIPSCKKICQIQENKFATNWKYTWSEMEFLTKETKTKTTLIPTGIKCHLPEGYYLHLSLRSSTPNKHWLVIANAPGIVDADYYNNADNEGHIYFQVINMSPFDIVMPAGTKFGQGIVLPYYITENDTANAVRAGGFGSTS